VGGRLSGVVNPLWSLKFYQTCDIEYHTADVSCADCAAFYKGCMAQKSLNPTSPAVAAPAVNPSPGPTAQMAQWCAGLSVDDVTETARTWAQDCLLDWSAVTVAGASEPLSRILVDELSADTGPCTVVGSQRRANARDGALINGAISHALDFDDVNSRMHGHPSVVIAPAVLALSEATGASGAQALTAFVAGYEVASALGAMLGDAHYNHGFHATATVGCVGAAAAAGVILGLDATQMHNALSLAGTQAAGLKSMFGTMAKPLHAGKAASNGVLSAQLAARGFEARENGLECEQGFGPVLSSAFTPKPFRPDPAAAFEVESNLFKFHAACYLTHSAIEAVRGLVLSENFTPEDVASITLSIPPASLRVCDIRTPRSGLDIKFSIRHIMGLVICGADTADLSLYSDASAADPRASALRQMVEITPVDPTPEWRHGATVQITLNDGRNLQGRANVGVPAQNLPQQRQRLEAKAEAIVAPVIGADGAAAMIRAVQNLTDAPDVSALMNAIS